MRRLRSSIRYKIGAWMLLLSLGPLLLVSLLSLTALLINLAGFSGQLRAVEAALRADVVGRNLAGTAAESALIIDSYLLERIREVRRWAEEPAVVAAVRAGTLTAAALELTEQAPERSPDLLRQGLMVPIAADLYEPASRYLFRQVENSPFVEVLATDLGGLSVLLTRPPDRFAHASQPWWQASLRQSIAGIGILDVHLDPQEGLPTVGIALPIYDPDQKRELLGVMRALLRLTDLQHRLSLYAAGSGAAIRLFTADGRLIADTASGHSAALILTPAGNILRQADGPAGHALAAAPGSEGAGFVVTSGSDRHVVGYAQTNDAAFYDRAAGLSGFGGFRWGVTAAQPESIALRILDGLIHAGETFARLPTLLGTGFALISLVAGMAAVLGAVLISGGITRPILEISETAREVQSGNLQVDVPVRSVDEVGHLSAVFNEMTAGLRARERERDIFGRVVSPEVRERLLAGELRLGGETRQVTVIFADIRGFSTIAEQLEPDALIDLLNEYLTEMTTAIRSEGGYLNNFIGDAIVAIFGAPLAQPDMQRRAVRAALKMRERLQALNRRRLARGVAPLASGIGISTGQAVAGQVGSLERLMYTVIGDAVNVAQRLEVLTKEYPDHPILMNGETALPLAEAGSGLPEPAPEPLGELPVKGRTETVLVFGLREPPST